MRFVVDAQLPPVLARWRIAKGHEAEHVADIGLLTASDASIWEWALSAKAVIVTKDEDFAIRRNTSTTPTPAVIWVRIGNSSNKELLDTLEQLLPQIMAALARNDLLIEIG